MSVTKQETLTRNEPPFILYTTKKKDRELELKLITTKSKLWRLSYWLSWSLGMTIGILLSYGAMKNSWTLAIPGPFFIGTLGMIVEGCMFVIAREMMLRTEL